MPAPLGGALLLGNPLLYGGAPVVHPATNPEVRREGAEGSLFFLATSRDKPDGFHVEWRDDLRQWVLVLGEERTNDLREELVRVRSDLSR